jgi:hypothetical protein
MEKNAGKPSHPWPAGAYQSERSSAIWCRNGHDGAAVIHDVCAMQPSDRED